MTVRTVTLYKKLYFFSLTLKRLGEEVNLTAPCPPFVFFSKNVSSGERAKHWFFVTFSNIISYIFPENLVEILQLVQKM